MPEDSNAPVNAPVNDSSEVVKEQSEALAAGALAGEQSGAAFYSSLAMSNAVSHQRAQDQNREALEKISLAIVSKAAENIMNTSPAEGGADVATMIQLLKGGALSPPANNIPMQQ